jgi:hypothetical protein
MSVRQEQYIFLGIEVKNINNKIYESLEDIHYNHKSKFKSNDIVYINDEYADKIGFVLESGDEYHDFGKSFTINDLKEIEEKFNKKFMEFRLKYPMLESCYDNLIPKLYIFYLYR